MTQISLGDMATHFASRRQNALLKAEIGRLSKELTTGRVENTARHLSGDLSQIADIEMSLRKAEASRFTIKEAATRTAAEQLALESIRTVVGSLAGNLASAENTQGQASQAALASSAKQAFSQIVSTLNVRSAEQALFSGASTNVSPMANPSEILEALDVAITGTTTPSAFNSAIDAWFDTPGGGFDTVAYRGSDQPAPPHQMVDGITESRPLRADDPAFKETLKALAKSALAVSASASLTVDDQARIQAEEGLTLFNQVEEITGIQAVLGATQERIEQASVQLEARFFSLSSARNNLLNVDTYDAATRLQETQFQLESLYAVTARMSRLSLLEYL